MEIINSNTLQEKFGKYVKKDEYSLKYRTIYHEDIHKYLLSQIENYGFIFNLLSLATTYQIDEYHLKIVYPRISSILKGLDIQYKFDNVIIE